ncbi:MAG TPA: muconolactone Delta-isomerase family protein [Gaiellaceae bacterium]
MEFLVEFELDVPSGTPQTDVRDRLAAESVAAAKLADDGHLVRLWKVGDGATAVGLYRADTEVQLDALLSDLPLADWLRITVTPLESHPNDPNGLPDPRLTRVFRPEAALGEPLELGETDRGRRRIVALTGGTFAGPELNGSLLPGASADWQIVLADGTALGDVRYTLQTDGGALIYVRSQSVRHGPADVLARLARGLDVDAGEYTFRAATWIETAVPELDWLNKGVFISVGGRRPGVVIYETYLVA